MCFVFVMRNRDCMRTRFLERWTYQQRHVPKFTLIQITENSGIHILEVCYHHQSAAVEPVFDVLMCLHTCQSSAARWVQHSYRLLSYHVVFVLFLLLAYLSCSRPSCFKMWPIKWCFCWCMTFSICLFSLLSAELCHWGLYPSNWFCHFFSMLCYVFHFSFYYSPVCLLHHPHHSCIQCSIPN